VTRTWWIRASSCSRAKYLEEVYDFEPDHIVAPGEEGSTKRAAAWPSRSIRKPASPCKKPGKPKKPGDPKKPAKSDEEASVDANRLRSCSGAARRTCASRPNRK
jgi:hypothetical protein